MKIENRKINRFLGNVSTTLKANGFLNCTTIFKSAYPKKSLKFTEKSTRQTSVKILMEKKRQTKFNNFSEKWTVAKEGWVSIMLTGLDDA